MSLPEAAAPASLIEPMTSLAFSMYSNRGVYALLLGSGISRAASIPTGWEVTLDLIRKVAVADGGVPPTDPEAWFIDKHHKEPDYSELLEAVGKTPAERSQLLRAYFEPTDEERERKEKLPTLAHHAIALLVRDGYIRVILTLNFDRLMEQALEAVGVVPAVVSTADGVEGALPLVHSGCTIVKIHGDYLDTRIKNTPSELDAYDARINKLLAQVLDEYGLITCGWSADWDKALLRALERCSSRRFSTYWTLKGTLGENAKRMVARRGAQIIPIDSADAFFSDLADKVTALADYARPHPLSTPIAVAQLKRYLEDGKLIRLHDLVHQVTEDLYESLSEEHFPVAGFTGDIGPELKRRLEAFETLTETLLALFIQGCTWGGPAEEKLWIQSIERIASLYRYGGPEALSNLLLYPALLLLYGGGIAALLAGKYGTYSALLTTAKLRTRTGVQPAVLELYAENVVSSSDAHRMLGQGRIATPLSRRLQSVIHIALINLIPDEQAFIELFDRFEYFTDLVYAGKAQKEVRQGFLFGPVGCFGWRDKMILLSNTVPLQELIEREAVATGTTWPILQVGLFNSSLDTFLDVKRKYDAFVNFIQW